MSEQYVYSSNVGSTARRVRVQEAASSSDAALKVFTKGTIIDLLPHIPNQGTIAAMEEGRLGGLRRFSSVAELMADLNEDD